ncbi:mannose-1-phosphate guanylyltransferase [Polyangium spumosum]|uniref:mannose-1-phosphate guanylyltransferase n=1 Tax=Polyangium spumosum TaxID=889282 RepID=A0A6N7Q2H0_9BACT|nr:sugar phosphate nucleotidyltransferase [Polyangium spumosum]MRG97396.1 NTP transferase domain-containing protein [Polyangium spumosum]
MQSAPHVFALILAGGAGTRFWPASRAARPKQLLPLVGKAPLIRQTAERIEPLVGWERLFVATGTHLVEPTAEALPELYAENTLVEPAARNTAPCIGWAAFHIARKNPDAVLMVLPSDHHVRDVPGFRRALERAVASAARGTITTIGIKPTHPETGYGYIELEEEARGAEALPAKRFVEKPDAARAEAFVAGGKHLWNAGMFFFRVRDMVQAIREHMPTLAEGLDQIDRAAEQGEEQSAVERIFPTLPSVSIDHGVMDHLDHFAVVPGDFGWSDVGSFQTAFELAEKDAQQNAAPKGALFVDARRNLVMDLRAGADEGKRVIALVGVEDIVVVETDDALLVVPRARAQDVKEVVAALKARGRSRLV